MTPKDRAAAAKLISEAEKAALRLRREAQRAPPERREGLNTAAHHYAAVAREKRAELRRERQP